MQRRSSVTIAGHDFGEFFRTAAGLPPYDYQRQLAGDRSTHGAILDGPKSMAVNVPRDADKRAANSCD